MSGAGHLPQAAVSADSFASTGPISHYETAADSGNKVSLSFCSECGSLLFKTTSMAEDLVFVCAGSLDEPSLFREPQTVYAASAPPWDRP